MQIRLTRTICIPRDARVRETKGTRTGRPIRDRPFSRIDSARFGNERAVDADGKQGVRKSSVLFDGKAVAKGIDGYIKSRQRNGARNFGRRPDDIKQRFQNIALAYIPTYVLLLFDLFVRLTRTSRFASVLSWAGSPVALDRKGLKDSILLVRISFERGFQIRCLCMLRI